MSDEKPLVAFPQGTPSDLLRLRRYDSKCRVRALIEMAIVRRLVMDVCSFEGRGYTITVNDGGGLPVKDSTDVEAILEAAFAVDECWLSVNTPKGKCAGVIFLVFGNDGWDVICDYHLSLDPMLKGVNEYAEALSEWC